MSFYGAFYGLAAGLADLPDADEPQDEGEWGAGPWGDSANNAGDSFLFFRDGVFRLRRRAARQKCSVFSIEFSDQGGAVPFSPSALAIELGRKTGLDRIP